ncbi:hypothetical protein VTH06DRAFT_4762 [Thermothelomyces fergusii]
MANVIYTLTV